MHEIERWIVEAIQLNNLQVRQLPREQATKVVAEAFSRYVANAPRAWWMSLKVEAERVASDGLPLSVLIPATEGDLYFLAETETAEIPVYSGSADQLDQLIAESPFFEYYVLPKNLGWLLIESDHNEYYVCGDLRIGSISER